VFVNRGARDLTRENVFQDGEGHLVIRADRTATTSPAGSRHKATFDPSAAFHTYWFTRESDSITIGVDDATTAAFTPASLPAGLPWVYDKPMFAIPSFALGGDWAGSPQDAAMPQEMVVDWFRYTP
jgi:beta-glucanase (GH16 family)